MIFFTYSNFDGDVRNTLIVHRLMAYAYQAHGSATQLRVAEAVFRKFFVEATDIGEPVALADVAVACGVVFPSTGAGDAHAEALRWLRDTNELEEQVKAKAAEMVKKGCPGVPVTILGGKWACSGGQKAECFQRVSPVCLFCPSFPDRFSLLVLSVDVMHASL